MEKGIIEMEKKISELNSNLSQVSTLIAREKEIKSNKDITDLLKLHKDLTKAIKEQEEIKQYKIQEDPESFNENKITKMDITRVCLAYVEEDNHWYTAMINNVNEVIILKQNKETVDFTIFKTKDIKTLNFKYVKIQQKLCKEQLFVGQSCYAIYYEDGEWYEAIVDQITDLGVHVKFVGYDSSLEIVSFDSIKISIDQRLINEKKSDLKKEIKKPEEYEFVLPEHLKILPTDSEQQRLLKKKRVKGLKHAHKQKLIEKVVKEKQDNWLTFNQKTGYKSTNSYKREEKVSNGYTPFRKK